MKAPSNAKLAAEVYARVLKRAKDEGLRERDIKPMYARDMAAYFKTHLFNAFGGQVWARLLLTLGHVNADVIDCYQEVINVKIRDKGKREPSHSQVEQELRPQIASSSSVAHALAASQGQPPPPVRGVQHKVSKCKQLREHAQLLVKRADKASEEWWAAHNEANWRGSYYDQLWHSRRYERLRAEADAAWDVAEARSREEGNPFQNRDGVMEFPQGEKLSNVDNAVNLYISRVKKG